MNRPHMLVPALALALFAAACSDQTADVNATHQEGFVQSLNAAVNDDLDTCRVCHGTDLRGGTVGVDCFTSNAAGPPFLNHPKE